MFSAVAFAQYELGSSITDAVIYILIGLSVFLLSSKALKIIKKEEVDFVFSRIPRRLVFAKRILMKLV